MKILISSLMLSSIFALTSCDTTDSDIVDSQSKIYARYKIEATKGSKRIKGSVTFYQRDKKFFDDYIALRGQSHVDFQGIRMQEIRTMFDRTHYENTFTHFLSIGKGESYRFKYLNNDGDTFNNNLELPSSVSLITDSIKVLHQDGVTIVSFMWSEDFPNQNTFNFGKTSSKSVTLGLETPYSSTVIDHEIKSNPARIVISESHSELKNIKLCSHITLKASGASGRTKKTSIFCNKKYDLK